MFRRLGKRTGRVRAGWVAAALLLGLPLPPRAAFALDASVLAGAVDSVDTDETTYAWQLDFRKNFDSPFAVSTSWINEGHFRDHHRDGIAAQLWGRIPVLNGKVSFAFGGGLYRYFDTRPRTNGFHENAHGWAPVLSLSASYYTESPWFFRFTANHIHPAGDIDTNMYVLGAGYRLGREPARTPRARPAPGSPPMTAGTEISAFFGGTIHNSLESRAGLAQSVEYRRGLAPNFDWTLSWINEDNRRGIRRSGIGTQVWLVDSYLRRRVMLGLGGGLYTFYDRTPPPSSHSPVDLAGIITLTAGYRFAERWTARANWHRVMTDSDRDADIFVVGAGYRWEE